MLLISCGGEEEEVGNINLISATINGADITKNMSGISISTTISLTFDAPLSPSAFENSLNISSQNGEANYQVTFQNASSRAIIETNLAFNTAYTISLDGTIGANGELLGEAFNFSFTTQENDIIKSAPPCINAADCLQSVTFQQDDVAGNFDFYSNYPVYTSNAEWEKLKSAIIVIHSINRNGDDYFNWMTGTLQDLTLEQSTVLIAPIFKVDSEAASGDLFWNQFGWREGANSLEGVDISSFSIIDSLVSQLSDKSLFPLMDKVIVTGHSSGGLFTHVYAAANKIDNQELDLSISYVVANSQYFYYPTAERVNESNNQLYTPSGCAAFNLWPLGYNSVPPYVNEVVESDLNDQFVSRPITYLLGNGNQADPSLNTTDCDATLLGSTRFNRGENMFTYMELKYLDTHNHGKAIVDGIGHDGQRMYQSEEFGTLLIELLN
ncbi:MAG: hypothetical protein Tsb0034_10080 [Ekhidna sp.]